MTDYGGYISVPLTTYLKLGTVHVREERTRLQFQPSTRDSQESIQVGGSALLSRMGCRRRILNRGPLLLHQLDRRSA